MVSETSIVWVVVEIENGIFVVPTDVFVVVDTNVFVLVVFVSKEFALFVTSVGSYVSSGSKSTANNLK